MDMTEITEQDFKRYEMVRASGRTNMFDARTVEALSGLNREKIMAIMKGYEELDKKYPEIVRKF